MIEELTTKRFRLISVNNYNKFQNGEEVNEEQLRNKRGTTEEQVDTNKNVKECKRIKKNVVPLATPSESQAIIQVIDLFLGVNPSIKKYHNNTTQRSAAARLLRIAPLEELRRIITDVLPRFNSDRYTSGRMKSITPYQLEENIGHVKSWMERKISSKSNLISED